LLLVVQAGLVPLLAAEQRLPAAALDRGPEAQQAD